MAIIQWRKEYRIGIQIIDDQHHGLVDLINKIAELKIGDVNESKAQNILLELIKYTKVHFETEEKHMESNGFGRMIEHKAQHKILIKQVVEILENLKEGKTKITDDLFEVLKNWLIKHVLNHDKEYGYYLESKNG